MVEDGQFSQQYGKAVADLRATAEDCVRDHWDEDYQEYSKRESGARRRKNDADEKQAWERRIDEIGKPAAGVHP